MQAHYRSSHSIFDFMKTHQSKISNASKISNEERINSIDEGLLKVNKILGKSNQENIQIVGNWNVEDWLT